MEQSKFSLEEAKRLYDEGLLKNHLDSKEYLQKFFFPTLEGNHFIWNGVDNCFKNYSKEMIRDVYLNRLPKDLQTWYFKENVVLYDVVSDIFKPLIDQPKRIINLCQGLKHKAPKKYNDFPDKVKQNVQVFLNYMKDVLCNGDDKSLTYISKWVSNMCKGRKNDSCLYLKGVEGLGKSTFVKMLRDHVLGKQACLGAKPEVLKGPYNKILCGKLFVVFEELPTFSSKEWEGVSSNLKDMITGNEMVYTEKYEKSFSAPNINNYIIISNVEAIKHSEGRRYFILDLSTAHREDHAYFGNIEKRCFNDTVGEALFSYFLEIDTTNFNAQQMPDTQSKLNAIAERLDPVYKFLKECYILRNTGIKLSVGELYQQYVQYSSLDKKVYSKFKFNEKLREVQIEYKKNDRSNFYEESAKRLAEIANKFKWIHEFDEFQGDDKKQKHELDGNDSDEDNTRTELEELRKIVAKLTQQNEDLTKRLQKYEKKPTSEDLLSDDDFEPEIKTIKPKAKPQKKTTQKISTNAKLILQVC